MMRHFITFVVIIIINTVISVLYLLYQRIRENDKEEEQLRSKSYMIGFFVMLFCPVVGPIFYALSYVVYKLFFSEPVDLEDVIFSKERVKTAVRAQEEQERNMVSLEEAIAITNEKDLRSLMMNIVRGDIRQYLASISLALNSEDSETAHYAASVLQDALNDFRINVEKQKKLAFTDSPEQHMYLDMLVDYLRQVLEQHVFNEMEQKTYVEVMDQVCEKYYLKFPDRMTSPQLESMCRLLLDVEDYEGCRRWCERSKDLYPNALATFTCQLKLYFTLREKEDFFRVVDELKSSSVVIDSETLELIRVFR